MLHIMFCDFLDARSHSGWGLLLYLDCVCLFKDNHVIIYHNLKHKLFVLVLDLVETLGKLQKSSQVP
jgi:hypothetical protein